MLSEMLNVITTYRIEDREGRQWPGDRAYYRDGEEAARCARAESVAAGARPEYLRAVPCFVAEISSEKGPSVFVPLGAPVVVV